MMNLKIVLLTLLCSFSISCVIYINVMNIIFFIETCLWSAGALYCIAVYTVCLNNTESTDKSIVFNSIFKSWCVFGAECVHYEVKLEKKRLVFRLCCWWLKPTRRAQDKNPQRLFLQNVFNGHWPQFLNLA